jgi:O2-independent ubiquinone biosynthesis protein UbiV
MLTPLSSSSRTTVEAPKLTLGPVLFNWSPDKWRDFYLRIADESPVDVVYLGEVVCAKRLPFFAPCLPDVVERLERAGKDVVFSTLALVMSNRESGLIRDLVSDDRLIEANDISAVSRLAGRNHVIGPYINAYNESTLQLLMRRGAVRACLNCELPLASIRLLARSAMPLEVQVFGRAPLAISARCYHARAENLHKDGCRFVCDRDPDGLDVETIEGQPFLAVNGVQTLSHSCISLAGHLRELVDLGIRFFRLSPHSVDMIEVARRFRDVLDGRRTAADANRALQALVGRMQLSDGFYRGLAGATTLNSRQGKTA